MQTLEYSFLKARVLIKEAIRQYRKGLEKEEEGTNEFLQRRSNYSKEWLEQIRPEDLYILQYLYLLYLKAGESIFTKEEYQQMFFRNEFKTYAKKERDYAFENFLMKESEENEQQYLLLLREQV